MNVVTALTPNGITTESLFTEAGFLKFRRGKIWTTNSHKLTDAWGVKAGCEVKGLLFDGKNVLNAVKFSIDGGSQALAEAGSRGKGYVGERDAEIRRDEHLGGQARAKAYGLFGQDDAAGGYLGLRAPQALGPGNFRTEGSSSEFCLCGSFFRIQCKKLHNYMVLFSQGQNPPARPYKDFCCKECNRI